MSTSSSIPPPPRQKETGAVTVFFVAAALGFLAMVAALLGSDSVVATASLGMTSHGLVYLVFGVFGGFVLPRYYWATVLGLCAAVFGFASLAVLLITSGESIEPVDRETMFYGAQVTVASFVGACAGVAIGRRLKRRS